MLIATAQVAIASTHLARTQGGYGGTNDRDGCFERRLPVCERS
jgi:hypothetical protein